MSDIERPDQGESYVKSEKRNYCVAVKCTATCLEELKSCSGYNPSCFDFMQGCSYCGRSGKCLRPVGDKQ